MGQAEGVTQLVLQGGLKIRDSVQGERRQDDEPAARVVTAIQRPPPADGEVIFRIHHDAEEHIRAVVSGVFQVIEQLADDRCGEV